MGYTKDKISPVIGSTVHPHLRGVYPEKGSLALDAVRFIPTCVGYTSSRGGFCGKPPGSSPLAWGIRDVRAALACCSSVHPHLRGVYNRNIPWNSFPRLVHPHLRGVYQKQVSPEGTNSSVHPHLRGVYWRIGLYIVQVLRFIPTCVGYTE